MATAVTDPLVAGEEDGKAEGDSSQARPDFVVSPTELAIEQLLDAGPVFFDSEGASHETIAAPLREYRFHTEMRDAMRGELNPLLIVKATHKRTHRQYTARYTHDRFVDFAWDRRRAIADFLQTVELAISGQKTEFVNVQLGYIAMPKPEKVEAAAKVEKRKPSVTDDDYDSEHEMERAMDTGDTKIDDGEELEREASPIASEKISGLIRDRYEAGDAISLTFVRKDYFGQTIEGYMILDEVKQKRVQVHEIIIDELQKRLKTLAQLYLHDKDQVDAIRSICDSAKATVDAFKAYTPRIAYFGSAALEAEFLVLAQVHQSTAPCCVVQNNYEARITTTGTYRVQASVTFTGAAQAFIAQIEHNGNAVAFQQTQLTNVAHFSSVTVMWVGRVNEGETIRVKAPFAMADQARNQIVIQLISEEA
jgi:hypothetical protein